MQGDPDLHIAPHFDIKFVSNIKYNIRKNEIIYVIGIKNEKSKYLIENGKNYCT